MHKRLSSDLQLHTHTLLLYRAYILTRRKQRNFLFFTTVLSIIGAQSSPFSITFY